MATTYAELQTEGLAWLRNEAATDQVTNFISQAEDEINAKTRGVRRAATAIAAVSTATVTLPDDFQDVRSFRLTDGARNVPLLPVTPERLASLRADYAATGEPEVYAIVGDAFHLYPEPTATYASELVYTARLAKLSDSNTSNWVLAGFPNVYLNGLLWRGYAYLKNRDMSEYYGALFLAGLDDLRRANRTVAEPLLRTDFPLGGPCNPDMTRA